MEKLRFAPYRKINRRNISVVEIAIAAFGAACWCVLIKDMFGLSFDTVRRKYGNIRGQPYIHLEPNSGNRWKRRLCAAA